MIRNAWNLQVNLEITIDFTIFSLFFQKQNKSLHFPNVLVKIYFYWLTLFLHYVFLSFYCCLFFFFLFLLPNIEAIDLSHKFFIIDLLPGFFIETLYIKCFKVNSLISYIFNISNNNLFFFSVSYTSHFYFRGILKKMSYILVVFLILPLVFHC